MIALNSALRLPLAYASFLAVFGGPTIGRTSARSEDTHSRQTGHTHSGKDATGINDDLLWDAWDRNQWTNDSQQTSKPRERGSNPLVRTKRSDSTSPRKSDSRPASPGAAGRGHEVDKELRMTDRADELLEDFSGSPATTFWDTDSFLDSHNAIPDQTLTREFEQTSTDAGKNTARVAHDQRQGLGESKIEANRKPVTKLMDIDDELEW